MPRVRDVLRTELTRRIRGLQRSDGGFETARSMDPAFLVGTTTCRTNFFDGLLLASLCETSDPHLADVRDRLAARLSCEVSPRGSVNYWTSAEPLRETRPYPNDLDTTSCALGALTRALPDQAASFLGGAVRALTAVEAREGGPYRTWLVTSDAPEAWRDVDLAVNANVAWFLSLSDIRLDSLDAWLAERIRSGPPTSPYYPSAFPLWFFLARGYQGTERTTLTRQIISHTRGGMPVDLFQATLALCALRRLEACPQWVDAYAERLDCDLQRSAAFIGAFCIDSISEGKPYYAGSPALTAALCLEALRDDAREPIVVSALSSPMHPMVEEIEIFLNARTARWGEPLDAALTHRVSRLFAGKPGIEIPLLPTLFNECLKTSRITHDQLRALGEANTLGWIAYTIFDDVLDGEGDVRDLPLATSCLREVDDIFFEFAHIEPVVGELYREIMGALERANAWEAREAHFSTRSGHLELPEHLPSFGDLRMLADRSFGHALGPLVILLLNGCPKDSTDILSLIQFFRHALIARQLDDDAHDWSEDLLAGRLNAVSVWTIQAFRAAGGCGRIVDETMMTDLKRLFWEQTLQNVAECIQEHVREAERSLAISVIATDVPLRELLAAPRASAEKALKGMREMHQFMATYRI